MAKLDNVKRIVSSDYSKDDQNVANQLGAILNPFMEQVYYILNGQVGFDNLNQAINTIKVTVDVNGIPTATTRFSSKITSSPGSWVINAQNLTNSSLYPTGSVQIFMTSVSSGLYQINKITGLQAGNNYQISFILLGN